MAVDPLADAVKAATRVTVYLPGKRGQPANVSDIDSRQGNVMEGVMATSSRRQLFITSFTFGGSSVFSRLLHCPVLRILLPIEPS